MTDPDLHALEVQAMKDEMAERERNKKAKSSPPPVRSVEKFPEVTPAEMMKLRTAQCSEQRVADYFGLTVAGLRKLLDKDDVLKLIFDAGPGRGKAQIQVAQYTNALMGDTPAQKHFGEHNLDQKSSVKLELTAIENVDAMIAAIKAQLGQNEVQKKLVAADVIEGEFEDVS